MEGTNVHHPPAAGYSRRDARFRLPSPTDLEGDTLRKIRELPLVALQKESTPVSVGS